MRLRTFDGMLIATSLIIGVILEVAYLHLQDMLFNSKDYMIFVTPPSIIFLTFICIIPITTGLTLLHVFKKYTWSYQQRVLTFLKKIVLIALPFALLFLYLGIFDYCGVRSDGVYFREFPDVMTVKNYSWDDVKQVNVSMHETLKQGPIFNYVVVFKTGHTLDLWEDDINHIIEIDNILSKKGIHFEVGTLNESNLPPAYQNEIKQIRWLFRLR